MDLSDEVIKATILYHLRRKRVIGGVHTPYDTLRRGFPSHLGKEITKLADQLIKKEYILTKPTNQGIHVLLNRERIKEIDEIIKMVLGFSF